MRACVIYYQVAPSRNAHQVDFVNLDIGEGGVELAALRLRGEYAAADPAKKDLTS